MTTEASWAWTETDEYYISMLGLQSLHTLLIDTRVMKILNLMNSLTGLELLQK